MNAWAAAAKDGKNLRVLSGSRVESGTVDGWRISGGGDGDDEGPAIVQQDVEKRRGKGGGGLLGSSEGWMAAGIS